MADLNPLAAKALQASAHKHPDAGLLASNLVEQIKALTGLTDNMLALLRMQEVLP